MNVMLRMLRQHPLLVGTAEVLVDAVRYIAVMVALIIVLGHLATLVL
jgi:hypothetical protein